MSNKFLNDPEYVLFRGEAYCSQFKKLVKNDGGQSVLFTIINHPGGGDLIAERLTVGDSGYKYEYSSHYNFPVDFQKAFLVFIEQFKDDNERKVCFVDIRDKFMAVIVSNKY